VVPDTRRRYTTAFLSSGRYVTTRRANELYLNSFYPNEKRGVSLERHRVIGRANDNRKNVSKKEPFPIILSFNPQHAHLICYQILPDVDISYPRIFRLRISFLRISLFLMNRN